MKYLFPCVKINQTAKTETQFFFFFVIRIFWLIYSPFQNSLRYVPDLNRGHLLRWFLPLLQYQIKYADTNSHHQYQTVHCECKSTCDEQFCLV